MTDHYPSEPFGGKLEGEINDIVDVNTNNVLGVSIRVAGHDKSAVRFTIRDHKTYDKAVKAAEKHKLDANVELNKIKNRLRILNKDTLEVDVGKGQKMTTNITFLTNIETIVLHTEKNGYVVFDDANGNEKNFARSITECKKGLRISYIDGNPLNCKLENIRIQGEVKSVADSKNKTVDHYNMFQIDDIKRLERNEWILGKYLENETHREGNLSETTIKIGGHEPTVKRSDYSSDDEYKEGIKRNRSNCHMTQMKR